MAAEISPEQRGTPEPIWWGVTIGSLVYAVNASTSKEARDLAYDSIGISLDERHIIPTFIEPHQEEFQQSLTEAFGSDQTVRRVIPFTMEPWPTTPQE